MNSSTKNNELEKQKGNRKTTTPLAQLRRVSPRENMLPVEGGADEAVYSKVLQQVDIALLPRRGTMSNSSTQCRSSSPVKTIHDLKMADLPITFFEANSRAIQPPQAVYQLYKASSIYLTALTCYLRA